MNVPPPETAAETRDLTELVTAVFAAWRRAGIDFVVLRNYEGLPATVSNDIDILFRPHQIRHAERELIAAARAVGFHLHNRVEFLPVSLFFYHPQTLHQIQFDLFQSLKWRGFHFLLADPVLDDRIDHGVFAIQHLAHEAVNSLLTRLIYKGYVKENYKPVILAGVRNHPARVRDLLEEMFGLALAGKLVQAIAAERWKDVEAQTHAMRRQLVWRQGTRHPFRTIRSQLHDLRRFFGRIFRLPGITVVLLGADGSGKSTVADRLAAALDHTFKADKSLRIHWKPSVFLRRRRAARGPTTDPHGGTPRNPVASVFALFYHWLEFFAGTLVQCLPVRFRNGLVLIDRYHYDFVVDPRRYRLNVSASLARNLFRLMPPPDLVFLLDAPAEVLHSRKQEVPIEETRRQRDAFRALVATLPEGHIINCNPPPDAVVADITRHLFGWLESRESQRSKSIHPME